MMRGVCWWWWWWCGADGPQEQYLGGVPFATIDALETYAENTYSSLSYLALESFHRRSLTLDHIASHIGKASGIAAVLRGMPHLAHPPPGTQQTAAVVVFPLDVCAEFQVRQEDILRCAPAAGLADAVFKVATRANDHLITARKMLADAGDEAKGTVFAVFLQAVGGDRDMVVMIVVMLIVRPGADGAVSGASRGG